MEIITAVTPDFLFWKGTVFAWENPMIDHDLDQVGSKNEETIHWAEQDSRAKEEKGEGEGGEK